MIRTVTSENESFLAMDNSGASIAMQRLGSSKHGYSSTSNCLKVETMSPAEVKLGQNGPANDLLFEITDARAGVVSLLKSNN